MYVPLDQLTHNNIAAWEEFLDEIMHKNRFFPATNIESARLRELLGYLILDQAEFGLEWYRGRIQKSDDPYTTNQMGAPPENTASHGRANPPGIPYLYLASNASTAISEIRPHTGEATNIATFFIPENLKVIDLRDPRHTVSPFLLADETAVNLLRGDWGFLQQLGNELIRPVLPNTVAIDYLPSQYLCEFVKKCGFDGVMYSSSVSNGVNLALFNPSIAQATNVEQKVVKHVIVELQD